VQALGVVDGVDEVADIAAGAIEGGVGFAVRFLRLERQSLAPPTNCVAVSGVVVPVAPPS
jgi:hypothetical protein